MTAVALDFRLPDFRLPARLEAHEPAEARGLSRDQVRMLVGRKDSGAVTHHRFDQLPDILEAGDVLVVNTSGTVPAALDVTGSELTVHVSTELPDGSWAIELRRRTGVAVPGSSSASVTRSASGAASASRSGAASTSRSGAASPSRSGVTEPFAAGIEGETLPVTGGARVRLIRPYTRGRLWVSEWDVDDVPAYLNRHGRPIRYSYVERDWPISTYASVFATTPGSAEMPSASRPFTESLVTRLAGRGIVFAPILLHTGVASPEAHERPYPERFSVPASTARLVNEARAAGGRIIGVGTTAVRALESAVDDRGRVAAAAGWTSLVITPETGVRAVDGLVTGFHEPRASHLDMLRAIAGEELLMDCYAEALRDGYLWHEFGDINLLLPH